MSSHVLCMKETTCIAQFYYKLFIVLVHSVPYYLEYIVLVGQSCKGELYSHVAKMVHGAKRLGTMGLKTFFLCIEMLHMNKMFKASVLLTPCYNAFVTSCNRYSLVFNSYWHIIIVKFLSVNQSVFICM